MMNIGIVSRAKYLLNLGLAPCRQFMSNLIKTVFIQLVIVGNWNLRSDSEPTPPTAPGSHRWAERRSDKIGDMPPLGLDSAAAAAVAVAVAVAAGWTAHLSLSPRNPFHGCMPLKLVVQLSPSATQPVSSRCGSVRACSVQGPHSPATVIVPCR